MTLNDRVGYRMNNQDFHILVVDDQEDNREVLQRLLKKQGFLVSTASDGQEALELVRKKNCDLVISDIKMPVMDGYQFLKTLKEGEQYRHIPMIMISAVDDMASIVRCIKLGAEDYLSKPFDSVLLRARVEACLEKKTLRDQEQRFLLEIKKEQERADYLLRILLPKHIIEELKAKNKVTPRRYEEVAIMFCDVSGFTSYCDMHDPEEVLENLTEFIETCEEISVKHSLDKINSVGDEFVAAGGLTGDFENPVFNCVKCGLEIVDSVKALACHWDVRVGIHIGPVLAGVAGKSKFLYGLWGDTVNTAARMESCGIIGNVNLSHAAAARIEGLIPVKSRGLKSIKGKGEMELFYV